MHNTKLILVDGNSVICRYFYGLPEKKSPDGLNINGVYGFIRFLIGFLQKEMYCSSVSIVVLFDKASKNFRKRICSNYKKNRSPFPENFFHQMKICEEFCKTSSIPIDFHEEYEADDLIASYCDFYKNQFEKIIIISNDKDLLQLVDEKTEIYNAAKKQFYTTEEVKRLMQITPTQIPEFLAIAGDSSDNISGISGVGPKTAMKLLQEYGTLHNIINSELGKKKDFTPAVEYLKLTLLCKTSPLRNQILSQYLFSREDIKLYLERYGLLEM